MKRYRNLSGYSGVAAYALQADAVLVRFLDSARVYRYSHAHAGAEHVQRMQQLAQEGRGLATYIAQHVRDLYDP